MVEALLWPKTAELLASLYNKNKSSAPRVDTSSQGLHQVWPPPNNIQQRCTAIDIIAIHGLDTGSPRTWIAFARDDNKKSREVHWLKDEEMLPSKIAESRIFTYDWNAKTIGDVDHDNLSGHSNRLLSEIASKRPANAPRRPLIFIASCFGGLLLAKALNQASEPFSEYRSIIDSIVGIAFLGTPFRGSGTASAAEVRVHLLQAMGANCSDVLLSDLKLGKNDVFTDIVNTFSRYATKAPIPVFCFYETKKTNPARAILPQFFADLLGRWTATVMVPGESATLPWAPSKALPVPHPMLNKYRGPEDPNFDAVWKELKKFIDKAEEVLGLRDPLGKADIVKELEWVKPKDETLQTQALAVRRQKLQNLAQKSFKFLWLNGDVGCGKSTLLASIVEDNLDHFKERGISKLCYFHCSHQDPLSRLAHTVMKSIISQVASNAVMSPLRDLYKKCHLLNPPKVPSVDELQSVLLKMLQIHNDAADPSSEVAQALQIEGHVQPFNTRILLLLDALDELPIGGQRESIVLLLKELADQKFPCVHVLVASRPHDDIKIELSGWISVKVDATAVQTDIVRYVRESIGPDSGFPQTAKLQGAITKRLAEQSDGVFLWTVLQMRTLRELTDKSSTAILLELKELPKDLPETYERILERVQKPYHAHARKALSWIVLANRFLYIEEVQYACAIDATNPAGSILVGEGDRLEPASIIKMLQDLIRIHPPITSIDDVQHGKHTVTLYHMSVREYLVGDKLRKSSKLDWLSDVQLTGPGAHDFIARSCLAYLYECNNEDHEHRRTQYPLLGYAWYNWEKHVNPPVQPEFIRDYAMMLRDAVNQLREHEGQPMDANGQTMHRLTDWLFNTSKGQIPRAARINRLLAALAKPCFHPNFDEFFILSDKQEFFPRRHYRGIHNKLHSPSSIRLIEILPSLDRKSPVECRLIEVDLDANPRYETLSHWGTEISEILNNMKSRIEHRVPAIWVDDISINHSDYYEALAQLSVMQRIYHQCEEQVVYLGLGIESSTAGVPILWEIARVLEALEALDDGDSRQVQLNDLCTLFSDKEKLEAVREVFDWPLWRRSWCAQEFFLADNATVVIGKSAFPMDILNQIMLGGDIIQQQLEKVNPAAKDLLLVHTGWNAARQLILGAIDYRQGLEFDLPQLLWRFRFHDTNNPHQRIYSLLSLVPAATLGKIHRDYLKSVKEVFTNVAKHIIRRSRNLDILSFHACCNHKSTYVGDNSFSSMQELPSWVPTFHSTAKINPLVLGIFNGSESHTVFKASGRFPQPSESSLIAPVNRFGRLYPMGCRVDVICSIYYLTPSARLAKSSTFEPTSPGGLNQKASDRPQRSPSLVSFKIPLKSVRKLCKWMAEQPDGGPAPSADGSRVQTAVEKRWRAILADQWSPGERLKHDQKCGDAPIPPRTLEEEALLLTQPGLEDKLCYLQGRNVFRSVNGRLGLCPQSATLGDIIIVARGGAVPYVLRHSRKLRTSSLSEADPGRESRWAYEFIGECYLHGMMDGEVEGLPDGEVEWHHFVII